MKFITLLNFLLISAPSELSATNLSFAGTFTDHAVLQRDAVTPIWGWANPNELVTVAFAGQRKSTTANAAGKWMVKLDPMPAAAVGRDLFVQSSIADRKSKITDVLVGDVWLCSGQSNMHFRMKTVENAAKEIAAADCPNLRFFTVNY